MIKVRDNADSEFVANIPHANKKGKACTLIDVVIPADRYMKQKEADNKISTRV